MKLKICKIIWLFSLIFSSFSLEASNYLSVEIDNKLLDQILIVSTIDGHLTAVSPKTGEFRWTLNETPILKAASGIQSGFSFLPDPRDGTLYALGADNLKKLPLTIPQLVQSSPSRSADGIMYAGRKHDVWFSFNPFTGEKLDTFGEAEADRVCPAAPDDKRVFVGRTEYTLTMFDEKVRSRKWNATFIDYSSHILPMDVNYKYKHYSSSYGGRLVTIDSLTGNVLWQKTFDSLIVSLYLLENDGLHRLPFTPIGKQTLDNLLNDAHDEAVDLTTRSSQDHQRAFNSNPWKFLYNRRQEKVSLYPALYVGEFRNGLYALPALVDDSTATFLPTSNQVPLLPGPLENIASSEIISHKSGQKFVTFNYELAKLHAGDIHNDILLLGYHKLPDTVESLQIFSQNSLQPHRWVSYRPALPAPIYGKDQLDDKMEPFSSMNGSPTTSGSAHHFYERILFSDFLKIFITSLLTGSFIIIVAVTYLRKFLLKSVALHSQSMQVSNQSQKSQYDIISNGIGPSLSSNASNYFLVGKISFNPQEILGRGCEGTIVYKGTFDGRDVAVKRVVADCFNLADREVDLLRASDSHPNVVRYFCMESDSQFRYIALELCWATLTDYVENIDLRADCSLNVLSILELATNGLAHLHCLKIVHRDVKPHNILLSRSNVNGHVNVLISDFGLCKKLVPGRNSFSKRSGFTGTDGWIAPEMLCNGNATCAVDIFSLGCVYYYMLSLGQHPFGDCFRRQANIVAGLYNLEALNNQQTGKHLISSMLLSDPTKRPCAQKVLAHPLFWSKSKILTFFQEVSDRVDKEDYNSLVVQRLEGGSFYVVNRDWKQHIFEGLLLDLRSRRTYRGNSVRDLLRALRNKKNHFREMSIELKHEIDVNIPEDLATYFTEKFPSLLSHVYEAIRICDDEPQFKHFYGPI